MRRMNLALFFVVLYFVMFAFVVFDLVFQYLAKRLTGKNVSEMTYFCVGWSVKSQLNQCLY